MTKKEVAEFLGISIRLIERYSKEDKLGEVTYVRGKTGREARYDRAAIERFKAEHDAPRLRPEQPTAQPVRALVPAVREQQDRLITALESIATNQANGHDRPTVVAIESKPLLKLKEAQALTGLSREKLIEAIEGGKLHAVARATPRAPYRVKRSALDVYIEKNF
jgi:hypothetical protein